MNEKIRAMQREHDEYYLEANALLSKAEPTGEEQAKGLGLIEKMKDTKNRIAGAMQLLDARSELDQQKTWREDAEKGFQFHGKTVGSDGAFLGMVPAGQTTIDSYGTILEDVGPGVFGEKTWQAIQGREYKRAFLAMIRAKGLDALRGAHFKTIQEGLDDQGGVFVPADTIQRIIMRKPAPTRLAGLVTTLTTGRDRVVMPRITYSADDIYTTNFRVTWTDELPSSDTAAGVNTQNFSGNIEIPVYTAMMTCPISNNSLEDAAFPLQQIIEQQLAITIELLKENMILNGTGQGQPTGLLTGIAAANANPNLVKVILSGSAGAITADSLKAVAFDVAPQYDSNCRYVFNKQNTGLAIAQMKDLQNRYLFGMGWQDSGLAAGVSKQIGGYEYVYSSFMPNIGAANFPVVFGDLLGHYLIQRLGMTVQVLRETKAKQNQIELVVRTRFGGQPVEPFRLRALKSNNS